MILVLMIKSYLLILIKLSPSTVHITTVYPDLILVIITVPCQCQYCTSDQMILITYMKFVATYSVIIECGKLLGISQLLWEVITQNTIVLIALIKLWMSIIAQVSTTFLFIRICSTKSLILYCKLVFKPKTIIIGAAIPFRLLQIAYQTKFNQITQVYNCNTKLLVLTRRITLTTVYTQGWF